MSLLANSPTSLQFKVHRRPPEVVVPAKPTPHEFKSLSDIESLDSYKIYVPGINFYRKNPSKNGIDPVEVIRKALSEALVYYYPYAGRLREGHSGRLIVECTGEGVLFCEAYVDVTLDRFGYPLVPPIPCFDQLLFPVAGSTGVLNSPLLSIQVTRLKCGGFILGLLYSHTMSDAPGLIQFMNAIAEIARGATFPTILPIWERHLLNYKNPPQLTSQPHEGTNNINLHVEHNLCHRVYFFGPSEIRALKRCVPPHLRHCSSFEIVTATIWKCRVASYQPNPTEEMSLIWTVNLRNKFKNLIPPGFYGNAVPPIVATSTAKEIIENPLSYVLQVIKNADIGKSIEDYIRSIANMKVSKWSYFVTDLRYAGFEKIDLGWGEAVFGGPAHFGPEIGNYFPFKAENGEKGVIIPLCLPRQVMDRFEKELCNLLKDQPFSEVKSKL